MVEIYAIRIDEPIDDDIYNHLLICVSEDKRERIRRFHFIDDKKRTLYGDLMVRYLVCDKLKLSNDKIVFGYNEFGKPFVHDYPEFHFNISHSGAWVVVAISRKEVGIDVEQIQEIDLEIANRFFSEPEYNDLIGKEEKSQIDFFFNLWSLKESYIKYKKKGLSIPLDSFSFRVKDNDISLISKEQIKLYFKQFEIEKGYKLTVCAEYNDFSEHIKKIKLATIIR